MKSTIKYSKDGMMREINRRGELSCREVLSRYRVFDKKTSGRRVASEEKTGRKREGKSEIREKDRE